MEELAHEFHGPVAMALHALAAAVAGHCRCGRGLLLLHDQSARSGLVQESSAHLHLLDNKYYMDKFNEVVFAGGARLLGSLWTVGDRGLIDGLFVNGSAKVVGWFSNSRVLAVRLHLSLRVRDDHRGAGFPGGSCRSRSPNKLSSK
jgi:NADH-quinone oxidoreductase subunit L